MNSQSVYSLVATARTRADMVNSATFSDTVELVPWVRDSLKQLTEILDSRWIDWYTIKRPLTLLANVESYTLPSDFRSMQGVYLMYQQGTQRIKLSNYTREQYAIATNSYVSPPWPLKYLIQGSRITFLPEPTQDAVNAVLFEYTPHWNGPLLDWSPIDPILPNGWEEWVVLDVILKMKSKLNQDTTDVLRAKMEMTSRVIAAASKRAGDPPQMRDIYQVNVWPWYNGNPSGPLTWAGY